MEPMAVCPACRKLLNRGLKDGDPLVCPRCEGRFLRRNSSLEAQPEYLVKQLTEGEAPLACPDCLAPMEPIETQQGQRHHCAACGGIWTAGTPEELLSATVQPETVPPVEENVAQDPSNFVKSLLYGVSLPERVLRTAIGVTAGTAKEAAQLMVPQAFQNSKSYEVAIHNSLSFLTETIGGFAAEESAAAEAGEHLAKKAVGNFLDFAGLATLHVSPMWVLAAVSDIAYGSSTYLKELAVELEKQGIIDEASTIHHVDDVLDAIQNASGSVASSFDKPPFSVEELQAFVNETRAQAANADVRKLIPEREMRQYWQSLQQTARQENVSMFEAATAVAMHTAQQATTISVGAATGVRVAGSLLQRNVLQHYQDSLQKVRTEGLLNVVKATYQPYVGQIWNNFSAERKSWTESLLDPGKLMGFFNRSRGQ